MSKPIIVGYDGSMASDAALRWAVQAAADRNTPLEIIVTWNAPGLTVGVGMGATSGPQIVEELRADADRILSDAMSMARGLDPTPDGLAIHGQVLVEPPAKALVERSADATLMVVGTHRKQGFEATLLGSVSRQVVTHAKCPVVVARRPADETAKRVVVGIDGSEPSLAALDFAFDHASRTGLSLDVVHAWEIPAIVSPTVTPTFSTSQLLIDFRGAETRSAAEVLAGYSERYPDVHVRQEVIHGVATRELVAASEHAALVVVGSRGHGGFLGLLLGSVSHGVSHNARCPVAVVH